MADNWRNQLVPVLCSQAKGLKTSVVPPGPLGQTGGGGMPSPPTVPGTLLPMWTLPGRAPGKFLRIMEADPQRVSQMGARPSHRIVSLMGGTAFFPLLLHLQGG
ncbi:hypothetical protein NDU88_002601 [Pleurodeles waltl]|uniref:Uncharacterized protein n=1 Tax=Pleurodeles waltl TaxID=8319 RepID=A0AAV7QD55_PLEWA|nr:hypothetical protein NDU88_002601 [Pleurodeles waltl]